MKLRLFAALLLPVAAYAANALPIEFNGVIVEGTTKDGKPKIQVSLLNPNTGTAKWVTVGTGKFDTYTVSACNVLATNANGTPVQNPTVTLISIATKQPTTLSIKSSTIVATPGSANPPIGNGAQAASVSTNPAYDGRSIILSRDTLDPLPPTDKSEPLPPQEYMGEVDVLSKLRKTSPGD